MGYEAGDPVRVRFPFDCDGREVVREGKVLRVMPNGYLRIVFHDARDVDGCVIEQALVDPKHLT
ncbi:MAG TPA: hypothetical protein VFY79_13425 [Dehalococcoidia bacterium]|jgi:hypothetical protein|nr:hypothetical protein [Dehalococcoidia bacterium]